MWRNARRIAARCSTSPEADVESWGHLHLQAAASRGSTIPWHQDEAYWEPSLSYHAVGAWMPLDDVDVDNGCLWFVPGSHRGEVLPHHHLGDDPAVHILELVDRVDTSAAVPVPMPRRRRELPPPAHAPLRRARTRTDRPRRAWANEFQTRADRRSTSPPTGRGSHEGHQAMTDALRRAAR